MDALADILRVVKLDSAIFLNGEFSEPWCIASPQSRSLAPLFDAAAGHVIIYHLLCEGRATVHMEDGARVALVPGDLITFPHGHSHLIGSGSRVDPVQAAMALPPVLEGGLELMHMGGGGARSHFICGYLICDAQLCQAFIGGLPPFIKVSIRDDSAGQWLENSLKFSVAQAAKNQTATDATLTKLSEVLFAETLRRYAGQLPPDETGWFAASRDAEVGKALTLLHHRHAHPWTLAELARESGLSRTVLSQRFRHFLGEPPIAYLTRWRLRLGARALAGSSHSVAQIAVDCGYESEASFNRAFKREFGMPPARYRKQKAGLRVNAVA